MQWQHLVSQASASHKSRHAPNDAAGLILHVNPRSLRSQLLAAAESVLSHARKHDCQGPRSEHCCHRTEEHVDRWTAKVFSRSLVHGNANHSTLLLYEHMKVPRSDES